jgi:hypothetical protein
MGGVYCRCIIPFAEGCHYEDKANYVISMGRILCQKVYIVQCVLQFVSLGFLHISIVSVEAVTGAG